MKAEYFAELKMKGSEIRRWNGLLARNDIDYEAEQWPKYATVALWTVKFPDGCEADLKVNTNTPEDHDCWCELVLFDSSGSELDHSEVQYDLDGRWNLETRGADYHLDVVEGETAEHDRKEQIR